jgi:pilus assembly protein CpaE
MLRGAIICSDQDLITSLDEALFQIRRVAVVRTVDHYPDSVELTRMLRASAPQIIFIGTDMMTAAAETIHHIDTHAPGVQMIAIGRRNNPEILLEAMRAGVREFLAMPFDRMALENAITPASELIELRPPTFENSDLIFSFLPSKAGVGTTTIALNAAMALARNPDTRVALADFDLSSGMLRFMLKLETNHCVADAIEHAVDMDEHLWPQLVTKLDGLDVLHAGRLNPNLRIEPSHVRHLTEFMRRNYRAVCFDLSGNLERYSIELMHESKKIFLVCTPEIPSLHLAREKFAFLRSLGLDSRVSVLVNRTNKRSMISAQQIEDILDLPVFMSLPNDYHGVTRAVTAGQAIERKSELGQNIADLADAMLERKPQEIKPQPRKSLIHYFSAPNRAAAK